LKAWTLLGLTHPMPVVRVREAGLWAQSPQYAKLLNGEYLSEERIPIIGPYRECSKCHSHQSVEAFFCGECGTNIRMVPVTAPVPGPSA